MVVRVGMRIRLGGHSASSFLSETLQTRRETDSTLESAYVRYRVRVMGTVRYRLDLAAQVRF